MNLKDYSDLVSELSKNKPSSEVLKKKCEKLGIQYKNDSIELMSEVLALSEEMKIKKIKQPQRLVHK